MQKIKRNTKKKINKRAFTLTELIAALVILGILATTVIVGISSYIRKARENTYKSYVTDMKAAAENRMIECSTGVKDCSDEIPSYGYTRRLTLDELIANGYTNKLKDPGRDKAFCNGYVDVKNVSKKVAKLEYKVCLQCADYTDGNCDSIEPEEEIATEINDCNSLNLSENITTWTNKNRTIYFGCDKSGKNCRYRKTFYAREDTTIEKGEIAIANNQTCKVNVLIDTVKPSCNVELNGANIGANGWYLGNVEARMKIVKNGSRNLSDSSYSTGLSTNSKVDYNNKQSISLSTGIHTVFCYVKDDLGNEGMNYKEVKIDANKPKQVVALGYTSFVTLRNQSTISGNYVNVNQLKQYGPIRAIIIKTKSNYTGALKLEYVVDKTSSNMSWNLSFNNEKYAYKSLPESSDEAILSSIRVGANGFDPSEIDSIFIITAKTDFYTNKDMMAFSVATNEGQAQGTGISGYSFNNGVYQKYPFSIVQNNGLVTVKSKNASGVESSEEKIRINKIDKAAPTCDLIATIGNSSYSGGWTSQDVEINVSANDTGVSGVEGISMVPCTDDENEKHENFVMPTREDKSRYNKTFTSGGEKVCAVARDKALNYSDLCSVEYKIDKIAPVVKVTIDNPHSISKSKLAKIEITDSGGSELKSQVIRYGWNPVGAKSIKYDNSVTIDKNHNVIEVPLENETGKYHLYVEQGISDNAGNKTARVISDIAEVDNTAPTIVVKTYKAASTTTKTGNVISTKTNQDTTLSEWNNSGYYFDVSSSSDSGGSGIDRITWRYNDSNIFNATYNNENNMKIGDTLTNLENAYKTLTKQGIRYGEITIYDNAGNSRKVSVKVNVDKTNPTCISSGGSDSWRTADFNITGTCSDNESGCASSKVVKSVNTNVNGPLSPGVVYDNVGNSTTCPTQTVKLDKGSVTVSVTAYKLYKNQSGEYYTNGTIGTNTNDYILDSSWNKHMVRYIVTVNTYSPISESKWGLETAAANASRTEAVKLINNKDVSSYKDITNISDEPNQYRIDLYADGYRMGKVKFKNSAGKTKDIYLSAKIDRTAPSKPTITVRRWKNNDSATPNNSTYISLTEANINKSYKKVFTMASGSSDAASGFNHYEYTTTGRTTNVENRNGPYRNIEASGQSTIKYRACDNIGNCSQYTNAITVDICSSSYLNSCNWVTTCRIGHTTIFTSASYDLEAGTVRHWDNSSYDKLYILGTNSNGKLTKVYAATAYEGYYFPSNRIVWLFTNCINDSNNYNGVCPPKTCPDRP